MNKRELQVGDKVLVPLTSREIPINEYEPNEDIKGWAAGVVTHLDSNTLKVKFKLDKQKAQEWTWTAQEHHRIRYSDGTDVSPQRETIFDEAKRIVYSDRAKSYGNPEDNFAAIADMWNAYLRHRDGCADDLDASDVALMLILFKVARATTGVYKRDTSVDIAGYAECLSRIEEVT